MLRVQKIYKEYENKALLNGISFQVQQGELVCLLGSSGSGKSTMLRIIAGLEKPESGKVFWNEQDLSDTPTHKRGFGLMFQDYALFPHRSVSENIAFGLRMADLPKEEIDTLVQEALENIRMTDFADRTVTELSGGEQQRVALARALAPDPRLLMLDEPLGALDHNLRTELINELRAQLHESRKPVIYVTHDQEEAFALADRLILLHGGKLVQEGSPEAIFRKPASAWVASFLGLGNLIPGKILSEQNFTTKLGEFRLDCTNPLLAGQEGFLLLRPDDLLIGADASEAPNHFKGRIKDCVFLGDYFRVEIDVKGTLLTIHSEESMLAGEQVELAWPSDKILCLPE